MRARRGAAEEQPPALQPKTAWAKPSATCLRAVLLLRAPTEPRAHNETEQPPLTTTCNLRVVYASRAQNEWATHRFGAVKPGELGILL